jgi:hypothetical protein
MPSLVVKNQPTEWLGGWRLVTVKLLRLRKSDWLREATINNKTPRKHVALVVETLHVFFLIPR